MKKNLIYISLLFLCMSTFFSCNNDLENDQTFSDLKEIKIDPLIKGGMLRNRSIVEISGYNEFKENSKIVLTTIKRTDHPLAGFSYSNISYTMNDANGWVKDNDLTKKVYWTDANEHTFIGYSLPTSNFEFIIDNNNNYSGKLATDQTTEEKIKNADLLLTYSDTTKANLENDLVSANIYFTHALAKVKIVLLINGFAASDHAVADIETTANSISIANQPVNYIWDQQSAGVNAISENGEKGKIDFYKAGEDGDNNKKQIFAYGLVIPGIRDILLNMNISYPDALVEGGKKTENYKATLHNVEFQPGKQTAIKITLNHQNENITTDVSFQDWNEVNIPNKGELQKDNLYLNNDDLENVKLGDNVTEIDKADWLYKKDNNIYDKYGNNGTQSSPFEIKTAREFAAFEKEVNNGRIFENQYIKLTTDLFLQTSKTSNTINWGMIGNDNYSFNGVFDGGKATISLLKSNSLFNILGEKSALKYLNISTVSEGTSNGGILCKENNGTIYGCSCIGKTTGDVAGGICSINNGTIAACYHRGEVIGQSLAGGIIGKITANAKIYACYHADGIVSGSTKGGIIGLMEDEAKAEYLFFDNSSSPSINAISGKDDEDNCKGMSFVNLQSTAVIESLNKGIETWNSSATIRFQQHMANFPIFTY